MCTAMGGNRGIIKNQLKPQFKTVFPSTHPLLTLYMEKLNFLKAEGILSGNRDGLHSPFSLQQ